MTVTKRDVKHAVEMLAKKVGVEIELQMWSPGDGWTRYQPMGGPFGGSRVWRGDVLYAACWLAMDAVEEDRRRHAATFQNSAPGEA